MSPKYFYKKIKEIQQVCNFVADSSCSKFYNSFYKRKGFVPSDVTSYEDFLKVPLLNKDDVLETSLKERNYLPVRDTKGFSITSGTTKNKKILMLPFSHPSKSFAKSITNPDKMKNLGVTKIIYVTSPLHGMVRHMIYATKNSVPFVLSKPDNLVLSANMIKEAGIEGIISTPTILELLIVELTNLGINRQIRWVCLAGEHCSKQKRDLMKKSLPNADIEMVYGSAEAGIIGVQCEEIKKETNCFHPAEEVFLEVLNENGNPEKEATPGNVVITTLTKSAFPLIRYQINDMATVQYKPCKCGALSTFTLLGRSDFDSIKVQGTLIHTEAVERALSMISKDVETDYRLSVYEKRVNNKMLPELIIELIPLDKLIANPDEFRQTITETISKNLWLSPRKTLNDLVKANVFLPLRVKLVDGIEKNPNGKTKSIINFTI